jgi:uncharacterized protein (DUF433 family)
VPETQRNSSLWPNKRKSGKPVIKGTRITVELILEKMAAGETVEGLLEAYPHITREGILAALGFAAKALRADVIYPIAG